MSGEAEAADRFLSRVAERQAREQALTGLQAGLLVAAEEGIATDSRSFARIFDVAHALVLRELNDLTEPGGPLEILRRDARTMRVHYAIRKTE